MKAAEPSASYIIETLKRCWPKMSSEEKRAVRKITVDIGVSHSIDPKRPHRPPPERQAYQLTPPSLSPAREESSLNLQLSPDQTVSQSQERSDVGKDETRDSPVAPAPACAPPEVRRSSRANKGLTSKYD